MKAILATIIAASLSFGCGMIEGEQTTTDSGSSGSSTTTTSTTDTGGSTTDTGGSTTTHTPAPGPALLSSVVKITAGSSHTCAMLADGTAKCWGSNGSGQLGDGTTSSRNYPINLNSGASPIIDIDASNFRTCVVLADGTAKCWGFDAANVFASGNTSSTSYTYSGFDNATKIDLGNYSACKLKDNSSQCWGRKNGTYSNVLQTVAGTEHICNLNTDKTVSCYGSSPNGETSSGSISNASSISSNGQHTCAVMESGTVKCWGLNSQGQIGDGTTNRPWTSKEVMNLGSVTKIDTSYRHSCAILSDQTVKCWGMNSSGQLGHGFQNFYETASTVIDINDAIDIAVSDSHSCALLSNQTVKCWGGNPYGQLGNKNNNDSLSPVNVILN